MINQLTKDGLTGNSGFGVAGLFHVNAPYAATKGLVFADDGDLGWERVTRVEANKRGRPIIRCTYCKRPATTVDHCWPYLTEATHCAWHRDWMRHMKERETDQST